MLKRLVNRRVWIICDSFLVCSPLIEKLRNALPANSRVNVFSGITPDPTISTVIQEIAQIQSLQPDIMMGFGGGSTLDVAKAIIRFNRQFGTGIETRVATPTTSGTGSKVASVYVTSDSDKGIRCPLFNSALYPDMAILDPALVVSILPTITTNADMDMLAHVLEAYVSTETNNFADALAKKTAQIVFQYLLVVASKGDYLTTWGKIHNVSMLSGMVFSQAGLGVNYTIAHQLGGQFYLPRGLANALLLIHVIYFDVHDPRVAKHYARSAKACHLCPDNANDTVAPNALIHQIEPFKRQCALPSFINAPRDGRQIWSQRIPSMVQAALTDATLQTNSRVTDASAMQGLLEGLL